jgi:beta-galactosidase
VATEPVGFWPERADTFPEAMVDPDLPPEQYAELARRDKAPSLGRIGLEWLLPPGWDQVRWFGAGPGESYPDSRHAVRIGRFEAGVDELQTPYVRPQENGNRSDVRWAQIADAEGRGIHIDGEPAFNLAVRPWSEQAMAAARHQHEVRADQWLHLHTDHAVQGIGTAAVGPGVLPEHRLEVRSAEFSFILAPLGA